MFSSNIDLKDYEEVVKGVCQYPGDLLYLVWIKSFHRQSEPDRILGLKLMCSSLDNSLLSSPQF